jgi:RNA polymerase sigma-70 factor (ECF subfamily)
LPQPYLTTLYTRDYFRLTNLITRLLGDRSSAEEIVQEAFLRFSQSPLIFEHPAVARAWLRRTASNLALDLLRHRKILAFEPLEAETDYATYTTLHSPSAAEEWSEHQVDPRFKKLLQRLPPRQREVFLARLSGFKTAEVAAHLNLTPGVVRILYYRARIKMQQQIRQADFGNQAKGDQQIVNTHAWERQMELVPYQIGETLWWLGLDGELSGPYTVLAGPGRAPQMYACRLQDETGGLEELDGRDLWRDAPAFQALATQRKLAWAIHQAWYEAKEVLLWPSSAGNPRVARINFRAVDRELRMAQPRLWIEVPDYVTKALDRVHYLWEEAIQTHPYRSRFYQRRLFGPDGPLHPASRDVSTTPTPNDEGVEVVKGDPRLGAILENFRAQIIARGSGLLDEQAWQQVLTQMRGIALAALETNES